MRYDHPVLETSPAREPRQYFGTSGGVFHLWHLEERAAVPTPPAAIVATPEPVTIEADKPTTTATQTSLF